MTVQQEEARNFWGAGVAVRDGTAAEMSVEARPLGFSLDRSSDLPLYLQLKWHIIRLIGSGEWPPGMALPSVRQLTSEVGLASATVQRALRELEMEGVVVGRAGRGVFVADLTAGIPQAEAERLDALRGLMARAVTHAMGLGFEPEEIRQTVRLLTENGEARPGESRIVFVGRTAAFRDKYADLLREALADLDITVTPLLLADLEHAADAVLDRLEPIRCVVSLIGQFPDIRRLVAHRDTPLFGLVTDLTEETQHELAMLPEDEPIGLVAEEHYLATARALVAQYRGLEEQIRSAGHHSKTALQRVVRECPTIVHSLGSAHLLKGRVPPTTRLIELRYRPHPTSLNRLRALLMQGAQMKSASSKNGQAKLLEAAGVA